MEIADWRKKIDELDVEIVRLISARAEAACAIGAIKRKESLPIYEPNREKVVYEKLCASNPGPLKDADLMRIYERIIDVMRSFQTQDL